MGKLLRSGLNSSGCAPGGAELPRINAQNLLIIPDCCKSLFSRSSITILSGNELPAAARLCLAHPCPRPLPRPPPRSPPFFVQIIPPPPAQL